MKEKSKLVEKLVGSSGSRESFIRATLNTLIPSQLKALRLREKWSQTEAGFHAGMKQARISASEKPGKVKFSLETLIRFAATYKIGLIVKFVPLSEMERWEDSYSQDEFSPLPIEEDEEFLNPPTVSATFNFQYVQPVDVPANASQTVNVLAKQVSQPIKLEKESRVA